MFKFIILLALVIWQVSYWGNVYAQRQVKKELEDVDAKNNAKYNDFKISRTVGYLDIDDTNKLFKVRNRPEIIRFDELKSFKVYQDDALVTNGVSGAALNVGFGLTVGGTSKTTSKTNVEKIDLVYYLTGFNEGRYTYHFLQKPVEQGSEAYRITIEAVEDTLVGLNEILQKSSVG